MYLQKKHLLILSFSVLVLLILTVMVSKIFFSRTEPVKKSLTGTTDDSVNYPGSRIADVQAEMRNVDFRIDSGIVLIIKSLRGRLVPAKKFDHPVFNKKESFLLEIYSAKINMDMNSLSTLLNRYVFNYKDSPLKDIRVSTSGNNLKQEGKIHNIPFSMLAEISVTREGKMKLHPTEIKAIGIEVKGLMERLKIEMGKLISTGSSTAITITGNDLYLDPAAMLPPPKIQGHLKTISVGESEIQMVFYSRTAPPLNPVVTQTNYMYFRGGNLTFGKLTMADADMQIIDLNPADPFDFYLDHYFEQLTSGYHKTTPKDGLLIYMPDYSKMTKKNPERK